ncbi:ATP-binding protein [Paenibacillus soyae]|uniref:DNA topoisomerase (ATP-hydrolyzing) n=1 Tax=Paenibacillus soyae TaxID=2969249 RepID=A0A9X2MYL6_9BACL|nr:ATP-binding protein [Paenibacillus soyae]MCR2805887.1 ATP-binding protein [Paenibacillus soyae]
MTRNLEHELDELKVQLAELREMVASLAGDTNARAKQGNRIVEAAGERPTSQGDSGALFFSGHLQGMDRHYRWEPQERSIPQLLNLDSDKVAKILSALGHKQRIDMLKTILQEPMAGTDLVSRLNMGTTGQLYHHIKALQGADLLSQEERGGSYALPAHRTLPFLLLLAAASELLDTSDFLELTEVRNEAGHYLGSASESYDPHLLLASVLENAIAEHKAGFCSSVIVSCHQDGSVTVADNGRGIPVQAIAGSDKPRVQAILTEMSLGASASITAPSGDKGISIPVVNALSQQLSVEVRRDGKRFRQDYRHGIPQTPLQTVGITNETGTSLTFLPDKDIFRAALDPSRIAELLAGISEQYPQLSAQLLKDS